MCSMPTTCDHVGAHTGRELLRVVELAVRRRGRVMMSVRVSPMLATWLMNCAASMNRTPALKPPSPSADPDLTRKPASRMRLVRHPPDGTA